MRGARAWGAAVFAVALAPQPVSAANITVRDWGVTEKGVPAQLYTLKGAGGLEARISNFGAVLADLIVPTKDGRKVDVLLGFDDFKSYERGGVYGALIGRYVAEERDTIRRLTALADKLKARAKKKVA